MTRSFIKEFSADYADGTDLESADMNCSKFQRRRREIFVGRKPEMKFSSVRSGIEQMSLLTELGNLFGWVLQI